MFSLFRILNYTSYKIIKFLKVTLYFTQDKEKYQFSVFKNIILIEGGLGGGKERLGNC